MRIRTCNAQYPQASHANTIGIAQQNIMFLDSHFLNYMNNKYIVTVLSVLAFTLTGCQSTSGPRYQNARSFSEGLAPVQASNGRWGYINTNNQMVISAKFEDAQEFKGGRAAVKMNGKWGYINNKGQWQ